MKAHAILVGVDQVDQAHYKHPERLKLGPARENVKLLQTALRNESDFELSEQNCLYAERASFENFTSSLEEFKRKEDPNFYLLVYFTGHGFSFYFEQAGKLNLYTFYDKMVFSQELRKALSGFKKETKLFLIVDSCLAEGMLQNKILSEQLSDFVFEEKDYLDRLHTVDTHLHYEYEFLQLSSAVQTSYPNGYHEPTPFCFWTVKYGLESKIKPGIRQLHACLAEQVAIQSKPSYDFHGKERSFFLNFALFNPKEFINPKYTCKMNFEIELLTPDANHELVDAEITADVNFTVENEKVHYLLRENAPAYIENYLLNDSQYEEVEHIMAIIVSEGGSQDTFQITKGESGNSTLKFDDVNASIDNGVVLVIEDMELQTNQVRKGKKIKGKVLKGYK